MHFGITNSRYNELFAQSPEVRYTELSLYIQIRKDVDSKVVKYTQNLVRRQVAEIHEEPIDDGLPQNLQ